MANFVYMDGLDNKYLQKVNLKALQKETGMTLAELAELAQIGPKVIYKWSYMHKDSSRPDYNAIVRLFQKGATVETLFGVDYKGPVKPPVLDESIPPKLDKIHIDYQDPKFQELVEKALIRIEERKKQGIIK